VGITKKGAINIIRIMPFPYIGLSSKIAAPSPPIVVIRRTPPTKIKVLISAALKLGSVMNQ
jgi:hypothetical protein